MCLESAVYFELPDGTTEKMNFANTNVTVTVEMDANFNIAAIDTERKEATKEDLALDYSDYLSAYQCAEGSEGVELTAGQQYSQGDGLKICVKSLSPDIVQVESIKSLTLSQADLGAGAGDPFNYISDGEVADAEIASTTCAGTTLIVCHVDMQLLGRYFAVDEPGDLTATGSVELTFPTGRRLTVDDVSIVGGIRGGGGDLIARRIGEKSEDSSFNVVKVSLEPVDGSGSASFYGATAVLMSGLVAAAGSAILMV